MFTRSPVLCSGLLALAAVLAASLVAPAPLQTARGLAFDSYQRLAPRPAGQAPVRIVDIDESSLGRLGQWPWSRDLIARLVERLQNLGASAIVLDGVLAEPDRSSPRAVAEAFRRRGDEQLARLLQDAPDFDAELAGIFARGRVVTGFALKPEGGSAGPQIKAGFATVGQDPRAGLRAFSGAVATLPVLEKAAAGNGYIAIAADKARAVRSLPLLATLDGALVPSLALEAVRVARGPGSVVLRAASTPAADLSLSPALALRVGGLDIPAGADGGYWLHFTGPAPERSISAWRVLEETDQSQREAISGKVVLIGTSAAGLADLWPTPLNPVEPAVAIHAQAVEQILTGWHLLRPLWAPSAELIALLAASSLVLALLHNGRPLWSALAMGTLALAMMGGGLWAFISHRLLLDPALPVLGTGFVFAAALLARLLVAVRDRRRLRQAFGHHLAPAIMREVAEHPERLELGGERREITFLFTDLEEFASSQPIEPPELVRLLNEYRSGLYRIVREHHGTVDKIVGDAVYAMFNAPLLQPDHADRAVDCALALRAFSDDFVDAQAAAGRRFGRTRIGVNTGPAVVCNFGGLERFDYTAHGDSLDTAARLEAASKGLGTQICVAGSTVDLCRAQLFRPIGMLMLKGKAVGVEVFEPLRLPEDLAVAAAYLRAFHALLAGGRAASEGMLAYSRANPGDALAALHAGRIRRGQALPLIAA